MLTQREFDEEVRLINDWVESLNPCTNCDGAEEETHSKCSICDRSPKVAMEQHGLVPFASIFMRLGMLKGAGVIPTLLGITDSMDMMFEQAMRTFDKPKKTVKYDKKPEEYLKDGYYPYKETIDLFKKARKKWIEHMKTGRIDQCPTLLDDIIRELGSKARLTREECNTYEKAILFGNYELTQLQEMIDDSADEAPDFMFL